MAAAKKPRCPECNRRLNSEGECIKKKDCSLSIYAAPKDKKSAKVEKPAEPEKALLPDKEAAPVNPSSQESVLDRVPRLSMYPEITVHAYSVGVRGYRYTINLPPHVQPAWSKKMSGVEATQFLRTVKRQNRKKRLESKALPVAAK